MNLETLTREQLIEVAQRQQAELERLRDSNQPAPHKPPHKPPPSPTPSPAPQAHVQPIVAVVGALIALGAAAGGEYLVRGDAPMWQPLLLYALAALLLAATATRFVLAPAPRPARVQETLVWQLLAVGAVVTLALAALTFVTLYQNLKAPAGLWLWLATLLALLTTGASVWPSETPTARWRSNVPHSRSARIAFALAVVAILAVAITARVLWLDRIPLGINPDEGDRTATAMQVLRGTTPQGLFEAGWYRISMMYFYLLAGWLKLTGIGFVQARVFTGTWSFATLCIVGWAAARNWSWRVALLAMALLSVTGVALQFARETSEAGPTAALWALSIALMLEGARRGRALAWIAAGLAGGFSLYFYPSGRTWPLLALLIGCAWLVHWVAARDGGWLQLLRGLALAAIAAAAVCAPFFAQFALFPHEFALRFAETSALDPQNAIRLGYYDPAWSTPRLLAEQLARALGIFGRYGDAAGFWPTDHPLVGPVLALLILLGLGYGLLRLRDPRANAVALWAVIGMMGMVITVETPNLQRMATAVPALFLGAAILLDDLIERAVALFRSPQRRRTVAWIATPAVAAIIVGALLFDIRYYFVDYAQMNRWEGWNQEGYALTLPPADTMNVALGNSFHMVNSGWVRLLAPNAQRGGVRAPGSILPLPEDGSRGLAFLLYPNQSAYLPWLLGLYPTATPIDYRRAGEGHYFDYLYVAPGAVAATRGALVAVGAQDGRVASMGTPPAFVATADAVAVWSATLRVPQQWNYTFHLDGAPATLFLDGQPILTQATGEGNIATVLNLARGDHGLRLVGSARGATLTWARMSPDAEPALRALTPADLTLSDGEAHGFAADVDIDGLPAQRRQDNTLAACCLDSMLDTRDRPVHVTWRALLTVTTPGAYVLKLTLPGPGSLHIGANEVITIDAVDGGVSDGTLELAPGVYPVVVAVSSQSGGRGPIELIWTPPGATPSIMPTDVLRPEGTLFGAPLDADLLRTNGAWPVDHALETVQ